MSSVRHATLPVIGLGCGGAGARIIERALTALAGVRSVYVNPVTEAAYVAFDPAKCQLPVLVDALELAGYATDTHRVSFKEDLVAP